MRDGKRRSPILGAAIIALSFAAGGYLWLRDAGERQRLEIARLESLADKLTSESVPLRFMILDREGGSLRARIRLYDLAGRRIAAIERTVPGTSIYVDMLLVPLVSKGERKAVSGDAYLAFPYRLFTDQTSPASGEPLFDIYESDGFPRVMDGVEWSRAERDAIARAYSAARAAEKANEPATGSSEGAFGSAVHEASGLSRFETGVWYKVVCRVKGGVEIMED